MRRIVQRLLSSKKRHRSSSAKKRIPSKHSAISAGKWINIGNSNRTHVFRSRRDRRASLMASEITGLSGGSCNGEDDEDLHVVVSVALRA